MATDIQRSKRPVPRPQFRVHCEGDLGGTKDCQGWRLDNSREEMKTEGWAMNVAWRRGLEKAIVARARRLVVIMHRIWIDGSVFR